MTALVRPLVRWLSLTAEPADPGDCAFDRRDPRPGCRLATRDARLTEAHLLLGCADELIRHTVARHRPEASGPAAAVELDLLADRMAALDEAYDGAENDPDLLRRAAVLCAGEQWGRLAGLAPTLRMRLAAVAEAIAETAVRINRLDRPTGPVLALAPSPEVAAFALEEAAMDDELRRRTAKAGADSAYAAADGAFLPSLTDFLA